MKGWHFDPRDTKQQRAILRTNESAQKVRIRFAPGTRVRGRFGPQMHGEVIRHIPGTNSQGGDLIVDWANGQRGRVSPITVEAIEEQS